MNIKVNVKQKLTESILEAVEAGAITTINLVWALSCPKFTSKRRFVYLINNQGRSTPGDKYIKDLAIDRKEYCKYSALLSRLKKQGLIKPDLTNGQTRWTITNVGSERLQKNSVTFKAENMIGHKGLTIISYDIPENMRRERGRLRDVLKMAEFEQIHQSLWYGKNHVTKDFLKILKEFKIIDYIHIFEVNKSGSLVAMEK